ncbi:unnamed protein product [Mytilus coruscus]|uniref:TRIM2_3 n=1 Tax=Mytilus coruscus TaxID=42192 RepID=A0A6J8AVH7_MYTCO|nr:unnamed protein product [Mytilus coruscus]
MGKTCQLKRFAPDLQLFLSTHQITKKVHNEVKIIKETIRSAKNYNIEIEIHKGITSVFKDVNCFGRIKLDESTIRFPFKDAKIDQAKVHIQTRRPVHDTRLQLRKKFTIKQKGNTIFILGCIILANGNLLIADSYGQNVLYEYNEDRHFIRDIPVSARPYDLTVIDTAHIAVSHYSLCYIEIIDRKKTIILKTVKFKNSSGGISYSDEQIYVAVKNKEIVVLDMERTILNIIKCSYDVNNITTSKTRIYYTPQINRSSVNCCSTTGEEIWNFEDSSLITPCGIAVDRGQNLFVVGFNSNNLLMVQDDWKVSKTLLTKADGLDEPRSVYATTMKGTCVQHTQRDFFLISVI